MRKIKQVIVSVAVVIIISAVASVLYYLPDRPFESVTKDNIESISLYYWSGTATQELNDEEIEELIPLMQKLKSHGKGSNKITKTVGSSNKMFILKTTDGVITEFACNPPHLILNDKEYKIGDNQNELSEWYLNYINSHNLIKP